MSAGGCLRRLSELLLVIGDESASLYWAKKRLGLAGPHFRASQIITAIERDAEQAEVREKERGRANGGVVGSRKQERQRQRGGGGRRKW